MQTQYKISVFRAYDYNTSLKKWLPVVKSSYRNRGHVRYTLIILEIIYVCRQSGSIITTTRQTGGLLLAYKAKGLKPRLKSQAFTYVQAYCRLSPAGP